MKLFNYFLPSFFAPSVMSIQAEQLTSLSIHQVLLDIDNTIIDPFLDDLPASVKSHLATWKAQGITILITSNSNRKRVAYIAAQIGVDFLYHTGKPSTTRFKRFCKTKNITLAHTAVIGDQLLTDSWFAKKLDVVSIIVEPLVPHDLIKTRINRVIDRLIRASYHRHQIYRTLGGSSND